jgi:hypothetical protein
MGVLIMQFHEGFFLEVDLVDDGTMDRVVSVKNLATGRTTVLRYDAESNPWPEVAETARADYMEDLFSFLSQSSDF